MKEYSPDEKALARELAELHVDIIGRLVPLADKLYLSRDSLIRHFAIRFAEQVVKETYAFFGIGDTVGVDLPDGKDGEENG